MDNLTWKKSTRSSPNGGHCVEVATVSSDHVLIRDSKAVPGPFLRISSSSWSAFIHTLSGQANK
ncbi:DUF397 domain-containing protein [Catenuloplanes atrovinosus]|uniref:DUF397 domain-containing protein n=1 Tax=Catenuloplanes atrovinosus TaxID=137266 RepID=A0AAE4CC20_9ACTN|nr:DUF397 domain-containing protein [Catenuloplanes atrovinosus]MDR7278698.1 hypothetical protein [Catenuloplanes atrovinosus]